jgi:ribonuclease-3
VSFFFKRFTFYFKSKKDRQFYQTITNITGLQPGNISLYRLATSHSSAAKENPAGTKNSYERLEYLGDSVLGTVVAEYLFKKFPYKNEGFLTDIRSRIVNRESLNKVGRKMGLHQVVEYTGKVNVSHKSLYGDALEALVGAIYLDKGFYPCKRFILTKILDHHFDIEEVVSHTTNFKSLLIEWSQKFNHKLDFVILSESGNMHNKEFTAGVIVDDQEVGVGKGSSKKRAEQAAAEKACEVLAIKGS